LIKLKTMKTISLLILFLPFALSAQQAVSCMDIPQARQFDFWIGDWEAFVTGSDKLAGYSKIEMASGGCMILENWTSVGQPYSGKSMNFVDPSTMKWKQVWVGSNGLNVSEFLNGVYTDAAMRFEFEEKTPTGQMQKVKFHFYHVNANEVRQLHQTSPDGSIWTTTYDFTYRRKK
jgi:hypothetical protein